MSGTPGYLRPLVFLIALLTGAAVASASTNNGTFLGGYLSFAIVDAAGPANSTKYKARLSVTTGWLLGHGPCGPQCGPWDVGHATRDERLEAIRVSSDPNVFGGWMTEAALASPNTVRYEDVTLQVNQNITGVVSAVSARSGWEQETAHFNLYIDTDSQYIDVSISGPEWPNLFLNELDADSAVYLHHVGRLQTKIRPGIRNDTGRPNNGPVLLFQPVYKIKLNTVTELDLTPLDPDSDLVQCRPGKAIEVDGIDSLRNTVVSQDCRVTISAMAGDGFQVGAKGAVGVVVEDVNRDTIDLGGKIWTSFDQKPISSSVLQFLVEVVDQSSSPEFVNPTAESDHEFTVYAGAQLDIPVFVRPGPDSRPQTDVVQLKTASLPYLSVSVTPMEPDPHRAAQRVVMTHVRWQTTDDDVGDYVIQLVAVDSSGAESKDRSFIVHVKALVQQQSGKLDNNPYFILFPDDGSVSCQQNSTCILPIFAAPGNSSHKISDIKAITNDSDITHVSCSKGSHAHTDGLSVFRKDICFSSQSLGNKTLFFVATDNHNLEAQRGLEILLYPANPCDESPCADGATCLPDWDNFTCVCPPGFSGQFCDQYHWVDPCLSSPCLNNGTCINRPETEFYFCVCPAGFNGQICSADIGECQPDSCGRAEVCVDDASGFHCVPENRSCTECHGINCLMNPSVTSCPKGQNLCVTSIADPGGVRNITRGCADEAECDTYRLAQRPECSLVQNGQLPPGVTCNFCCVKDGCNRPPELIPETSTLHVQPMVG